MISLQLSLFHVNEYKQSVQQISGKGCQQGKCALSQRSDSIC